MIFSELYSIYYQVVARILTAALDHPLKEQEFRQIIEEYAFYESILNIEPAFEKRRWQLLKEDGTTILHHVPSMPLTLIQKQWLKAIFLDPRIHLFQDDISDEIDRLELNDIEPLFTREDYEIFDQYADGDHYEDESYIKNFRQILDAIKNQYPLNIHTENHRGSLTQMVLIPQYLEYSEKDDKIRLIGSDNRRGRTINLARIQKCERAAKEYHIHMDKMPIPQSRYVIFELIDKRNALERVLLHFAHFEKQAERLKENYYKVKVWYDKDDETELVIRILSFGPMIKVTEPVRFVKLIKERLQNQRSCGH